MAAANAERPAPDVAMLASTVTVNIAPADAVPLAGTSAGDVAEMDRLRQIGKYPLTRFLGRGAMGRVYLGQHPDLDVPVAVKVIDRRYATDERYRRRFIQEARLATQINHPNVIRVYDADQDGPTCYMVQEYVDGGDVAALLRKAPGRGLPLPEALRIVRGVVAGLVAAERLQIVHRDVKPSNILLTHDGEPKLADLGLARKAMSTVDTQSTDLTVTHRGSTVGTPAYMAPEQIMTSGTIDIRADIYALGATLYELVTGQPPFPRAHTEDILRRHLHDPVRDPRQLNPALPRRLACLIVRMLAKRPEDRPPTAAALLQELDAATLPFCRRPAAGWAAAAAVLALVVILAGTLVRQALNPARSMGSIGGMFASRDFGRAADLAAKLQGRFPNDLDLKELLMLLHLLNGDQRAAEAAGADLGPDEAGFDPRAFADLFRRADARRDEDLQSTVQTLAELAALRQIRTAAQDDWTSPPWIVAFLPGAREGLPADPLAEAAAWERDLEAALTRAHVFPVVNRTAMEEILQELQLSATDLSPGKAQIRLGRLLPASALLRCRFWQPDQGGLRLGLELTETATSRNLSVELPADIATAGTAAAVAAAVLDTLRRHGQTPGDGLLAGCVEAVEGDQATLNLGLWHGLVEGQEFCVYPEKEVPHRDRLGSARPVAQATVLGAGMEDFRARVRLRPLDRAAVKAGMRVAAVPGTATPP